MRTARGAALVLAVALAAAIDVSSPSRAHSAVPGRNGRIAFGNIDGDIEVADADGGGRRSVTTGGDYDDRPAWSPDGGWIVFDRAPSRFDRGRLFKVRPDGTDLQAVAGAPNGAWGATWSPDGERLMFTVWDGSTSELYVVAASGGAATKVTPPGFAVGVRPSWSSRDRIVFVGVGPGDSKEQIYVMAPDGSGLRRLHCADWWHSYPVWSPDGASIAWSAAPPGGDFDIYRMPVPDDAPPEGCVAITSDPGDELMPSWSPDGSLVAFYAAGPGPGSLWVVPSTGGATEPVGSVRGENPDWETIPLPPAETLRPVETLPPKTPVPPPAQTATPASTSIPIPTSSSPAPPTDTSSHATITPGVLEAGDRVRVSGLGFLPGAELAVTLRSEPTSLTSTGAGPDGRYLVEVRIPPDTPSGTHSIHVTGRSMRGQHDSYGELRVRAASGPTKEPSAFPWWIVVVLGTLMVGSLVALYVRRRVISGREG